MVLKSCSIFTRPSLLEKLGGIIYQNSFRSILAEKNTRVHDAIDCVGTRTFYILYKNLQNFKFLN